MVCCIVESKHRQLLRILSVGDCYNNSGSAVLQALALTCLCKARHSRQHSTFDCLHNWGSAFQKVQGLKQAVHTQSQTTYYHRPLQSPTHCVC